MHVFFLLFFIFLAACNRPNPTPEVQDPIYRDLQAQYTAAVKEVDSLRKEKQAAKEQASGAQPQTGEAKSHWSAYYATEKALEKAEQNHKYIKLRLESRLKESRMSYAKALEERKPWPDPEELRVYEQHKRLQQAPRSWDERLKQQLKTARPAPPQ